MAQMQMTVPMNATASNGLGGRTNENDNLHILTSPAPGLELLYDVCRHVYPGQENPLQVTAFIKYWLVPKSVSPHFTRQCLEDREKNESDSNKI